MMKHATQDYSIFSNTSENLAFLKQRYAQDGEFLALRAFTPEKRSHHEELSYYQTMQHSVGDNTALSFSLLTHFSSTLYTSKEHPRTYPATGIIAVAREHNTNKQKKNVVASAFIDSITGDGIHKSANAIRYMQKHNISLDTLENTPPQTGTGWNEILLNCTPEDIRCIFFSSERNHPNATFNSMLDALAIHYALKEAFGITIDIRQRTEDGIFGKKIRAPKEDNLKTLIHTRFPHLSSVIYSSSHATEFDALSHPLDIAQFVNALTHGHSIDRHQPKTREDSKDFSTSFEHARTPWTERIASRHATLSR